MQEHLLINLYIKMWDLQVWSVQFYVKPILNVDFVLYLILHYIHILLTKIRNANSIFCAAAFIDLSRLFHLFSAKPIISGQTGIPNNLAFLTCGLSKAQTHSTEGLGT